VNSTLKPGGYIESFEFIEFNLFCDDGTYTSETAAWKYYDLINKAATKSGRPLTLSKPLREAIVEAGFKNMREKMFKIPVGTWPADPKLKELGRWCMLAGESGFEAHGLALLTRVLGMPIGEVKQLISDCIAEIRGKKFHAYGIM